MYNFRFLFAVIVLVSLVFFAGVSWLHYSHNQERSSLLTKQSSVLSGGFSLSSSLAAATTFPEPDLSEVNLLMNPSFVVGSQHVVVVVVVDPM